MPEDGATHQAHPLIDRRGEANPLGRMSRIAPDFAALAGWREGFTSPQHKQEVAAAISDRHAICPRCRFDLIGQLRPDCPECGWHIDAGKLIYPDDPPGPLLLQLLLAIIAACWLAMATVGVIWHPAAAPSGYAVFFIAQVAAGWKVLTLITDPAWWQDTSPDDRKPWILWCSAALGAILAVVTVSAMYEILMGPR